MRLLIKLRCTESCSYEMQYHYHLQGYIYNLLKGSKYDYVHDKEGYKFFCFSNIFPANDLVKDDTRTLLISSPDSGFIKYLSEVVRQPWNKWIHIGSIQLEVEYTQVLDQKIPEDGPFSLITGTPIIVRIAKDVYLQYNIKPKHEYNYLYWRTEYPVEIFLTQLELNLRKKFHDFSESHSYHDAASSSRDEDSVFSLFQRAYFKKQISTKIGMKGAEYVVIGTVWQFDFEGWEDRQLLQFALDSGLGERNSIGFGFVNLVKSSEK